MDRVRFTIAIVACAMAAALCCSASASAAARPTLSLTAAGKSVTVGQSLRLNGTLRHAPANADEVVILKQSGTRWRRVAVAELTAKHGFSVKVRFSAKGVRRLIARCGTGKGTTRSNVVVVRVKAASSLPGDENSFFGGLLNKVVSGLISGASGQIGNQAMGQILSLLGWGSNDSGNSQALQDMDAELADIEQTLVQIQQELANLETELQITEEEIIANTNDPTGAITEIGTFMNELEGMADGVPPGGGNQTQIVAFADQVEGGFRIENDVNTIYSAIIPPDSVKVPVLDNYTDLAINKVDQGSDLSDAYLGLEQYFTQLVYHQMRGVDLVVEAKQALAAAGQPAGTSASQYLLQFRTTQLAPEVQNFLDNAWRLVLSQADLQSTSGFLPNEAVDIGSRAEFLAIQLLDDDHFGLRAVEIVTADWAGKMGNEDVTADCPGNEWSALASTTTTVTGPTYDYWAGDTVMSSSTYTVMTYDFGMPSTGDYSIQGPGFMDLGSASVQEYDDDYVVDSSQGTIVYGCAVGSTRTGALDGFAEHVTIRTWIHPGATNVTCTGAAGENYIGINGNNSNDSYSGTNEVDYTFVYGGSTQASVSIPFSANPVGSEAVSCNADSGGSADATMGYSIGVWDATAGNAPVGYVGGSQSVYTNDSASVNRTITQTFTFTASPNHTYYVFFCATVGGSSQYGSSRAAMQVGCGGDLQIQFAD